MNPNISTGILGAVALVILAIALILFSAKESSDQYPLDKACYSIIGKSGEEYKSWFPPMPAEAGIFTFNNDGTWGYVFGPEALIADRDCLRERGVDVPPLNGQDE